MESGPLFPTSVTLILTNKTLSRWLPSHKSCHLDNQTLSIIIQFTLVPSGLSQAALGDVGLVAPGDWDGPLCNFPNHALRNAWQSGVLIDWCRYHGSNSREGWLAKAACGGALIVLVISYQAHCGKLDTSVDVLDIDVSCENWGQVSRTEWLELCSLWILHWGDFLDSATWSR